ncbi:MAG: GAF domain-containing protein [Spirochaetaceae bacterium]|nr:MAG: GAF domain-containing protein [Spirochaetaceae bacterium]
MALPPTPYLAWQLVPAALMALIGLSIQLRGLRTAGARAFVLLLYTGSVGALAGAIQLVSPDPLWQRLWRTVLYASVMVVPTAWFLLAVRITTISEDTLDRLGWWIWAPPALLYGLFVTTRLDGIFIAHTVYSYLLLLGGAALILVWVARNSRDGADLGLGQSDPSSTRDAFDAVLDTLQDSYFEADPRGIITYANRAFHENLGLPDRGSVIGRNFRRFTDPRSIRALYHNFGELYRTRRPVPRFEYFFRPVHGEPRPGEISISPVIRDGVVCGSRGLIRDVSERIHAEGLLRDAKDAAEAQTERFRAVNRVAATVSRTLDLDTVLRSVCEELTRIYPVRNAGVALITRDRQNLEVVAFHSPLPEEPSALGMVLPFAGNQSSQEVIRTRKPLVLQDAQNDPRSGTLSEISRARGTRALMIVPILSRGEAIGTIGMPAIDPFYVFTESEVELAETIASQIATAIDNARLHAQTEAALSVVENELEIGRQIQSGFFPERLPVLTGWELAAEFKAARQVAGDFYDAFTVPDTPYTAFVIADVCDKGVGAALFMVLFRSLIRAFSVQAAPDEDPADALRRLFRRTNDFIAEYHGRSNMFATLFMGLLDPVSGEFHYVNGGHEPPVMLDAGGRVVSRFAPTGPAVGMLAGMEFTVASYSFAPGDCLVCFTDGTTDARGPSGLLFTEERLINLIAYPWTSIFSMLFELDVEIRRHIGDEPQFDDITLIALRRTFDGSGLSRHAICREARMETLPELREFVESAARHCELSDEVVFAFKSSADEVCANIVQHGYRGREAGLISLCFSVEPGVIARLVIGDDGEHFPPDQAPAPDLDADWTDREEGGLGLHLVRVQMDRVSYSRPDGTRNELVLEKNLEQPRPIEGA